MTVHVRAHPNPVILVVFPQNGGSELDYGLQNGCLEDHQSHRHQTLAEKSIHQRTVGIYFKDIKLIFWLKKTRTQPIRSRNLSF